MIKLDYYSTIKNVKRNFEHNSNNQPAKFSKAATILDDYPSTRCMMDGCC